MRSCKARLLATTHVGRSCIATCAVLAVLVAPVWAQRATCTGPVPPAPPIYTVRPSHLPFTNTNNTIWVKVATNGTVLNKNGWGGAIVGIYYRQVSTDPWSANLVDDYDMGRTIGSCYYEGPLTDYTWNSGCLMTGWNPRSCPARSVRLGGLSRVS